jgi:hypothetical protein
MRRAVLRYLASVLCVAVIPFALAYVAIGLLRAAGFDLTAAAIIAGGVAFLAISAGGLAGPGDAKGGGGNERGDAGS